MGRKDSVLDNVGSGVLCAGIDLSDVTVLSSAINDFGKCFENHSNI